MADQADAVRLNDLYETDFYEWTQQQARLLRERRFADLDLENLIDEVGSVGSSEKREIRNRLTVLIAHLLKWKFQPGRRGESRRETIDEQRRMLLDIIDTSPSLRAYVHERAVEMYRSGRLAAAKETQIAFGVFPEESPFTPDQVINPDYFPEDRGFDSWQNSGSASIIASAVGCLFGPHRLTLRRAPRRRAGTGNLPGRARRDHAHASPDLADCAMDQAAAVRRSAGPGQHHPARCPRELPRPSRLGRP